MEWKAEDVEYLKELIKQNKSTPEIAVALNRKISAIRMKCSRLGISLIDEGSGRPTKFESKILKDDISTRLMRLQNYEATETEKILDIPDEKLLQYLSDYPLFIKELCNTELQDYQIEMIDLMKKSKRVIFNMGRQIGKTFTTSLFCIAQSICNPEQKILIIAPAFRQSRIMFDTITRFLVGNDHLFFSVKKSIAGMEFSIKFKNGSEIYALPSGDRGENIRGFSGVTHIIAEEVAHGISDEVFQAIEPMLALKNGSLILISTPSGCQGKFWECYNSNLYDKMHLPSYKNKFLSSEWMEIQKQNMSDIAFQTEIEANFSENISNFFKFETIKQCLSDHPISNFPHPDCQTSYLGIDWGRFHDTSALIVSGVAGHDHFKKVLITNIIEFKCSFPEQEVRINKLNDVYGFSKITAEFNGLGISPSENLKKDGLPVEFFVSTLDSKIKIFNYLLNLMEKGQILIPKHDKLLFQMRNFQMEFSESGKMKLHHSNSEIGDDLVFALAFSVWATRISDSRPIEIYGAVYQGT
jgi:hypothetical protein